LQRQYGSITQVRLTGMKVYLVSDPAVVQEALTLTGRGYAKGVVRRGQDPAEQGVTPLTALLGEGLLTSDGDVHKRQRRLMQPMFHRERIAGYTSAFAQFSADAAQGWADGEVRDVHQDMSELTLAIIARTVFDVALDDQVIASVRRALHSDVNRTVVRNPILDRLPLPSTRRRREVLADLDAVVIRLVEQRRALGAGGTDLLSLLLSSRDAETGEPMSDRQVRDEALTILLAGHETTANALAWALHLLATHPQHQARIGAELAAVAGDRLPTMADLPGLPFTKAVFSEAMRLYPPAWMIARHLMSDRTVCGYRLPAGAMLLLSPYVVHRDERYWPDPDAFLPDRWLEPDEPDPGTASRHRFAYFPFGAGPRQCIGISFAELEGVLCLATIARHWSFSPGSDQSVTHRAGITLRPRGGLPLVLTRRHA
jgi:cytochrome P450